MTPQIDYTTLMKSLLQRLQGSPTTGGREISPYSGLDVTPTESSMTQFNDQQDRSGPLRRLRALDRTAGVGPDGQPTMRPQDIMQMLATVVQLQESQGNSETQRRQRDATTDELTSRTNERQASEDFAKSKGFPNLAALQLAQSSQEAANRTTLSSEAVKERETAALTNLMEKSAMVPGGEHIGKAAMTKLAAQLGLKTDANPTGDPLTQTLAKQAASRGVAVKPDVLAPPPTATAPAGTPATPMAHGPMVPGAMAPAGELPAGVHTPQLYPEADQQARMLGLPAGSFKPAVFNPAGPTPAPAPATSGLVANPNFSPTKAATQLTAPPTPALDFSSLVVPTAGPSQVPATPPVIAPTAGVASTPAVGQPLAPWLGQPGWQLAQGYLNMPKPDTQTEEERKRALAAMTHTPNYPTF